LVRRLLQQGEDGAVRNENRDLTVLFTDIVGFSTFSEDRPAEEVANYLNDHFKIVADAIEAEGGTVDKFIGDSVMAFWGAPDKQKDRAERACRAAQKISNNIAADNRQRMEMGNDPVHIRIGIHSGVATVGNIGSPGRINYTVVGDVVNVASRMEQLGKELIRDNRDVTVLITETTRSDLSDQFRPKSLGYHVVKGREEQIEVFDLIPSDKESQ
jgi:adenylate cyclase